MRYEVAKAEIIRFSANTFTIGSGLPCNSYTKGSICYGFSWDGRSCGTISISMCYSYQGANSVSCSPYSNSGEYFCYGYNGYGTDNPVKAPEFAYTCSVF